MSFTTILAINLAVLTAVLWNDLGTKVVNRRRLVRPLLLAGGIGALVWEALPQNAGNGLPLVIAGGATGVVLGLLVSTLLRVKHDGGVGPVRTIGGAGYAAFWMTVVAARLLFSWGADHWFTGSLVRFMTEHRIPEAALTDALLVMALAMVVTRTAVLAGRVHAAQLESNQASHLAA
jgi:amino acid transporter